MTIGPVRGTHDQLQLPRALYVSRQSLRRVTGFHSQPHGRDSPIRKHEKVCARMLSGRTIIESYLAAKMVIVALQVEAETRRAVRAERVRILRSGNTDPPALVTELAVPAEFAISKLLMLRYQVVQIHRILSLSFRRQSGRRNSNRSDLTTARSVDVFQGSGVAPNRKNAGFGPDSHILWSVPSRLRHPSRYRAYGSASYIRGTFRSRSLNEQEPG